MSNRDGPTLDTTTKKRSRDDFVLDTPMKKMLSVMRLNFLAQETDVLYSSIYRYLNGLNKELQPEDYEKIKTKIQALVKDL